MKAPRIRRTLMVLALSAACGACSSSGPIDRTAAALHTGVDDVAAGLHRGAEKTADGIDRAAGKTSNWLRGRPSPDQAENPGR
jgi:hypothetical protein